MGEREWSEGVVKKDGQTLMASERKNNSCYEDESKEGGASNI